MHIHPSSPNSDYSLLSEDNAAVKIQAGFRGYRVRKQLIWPSNSSRSSNSYNGVNSILRRHHQNGMAQNQCSASHESTVSASTQLGDDRCAESENATVEHRCATKIQAGVRGFLVRKKQKAAADAAIKIQAGFRGFKARKEMQKIKQK